MKIAIIGMGVAGISVLREWTKIKETNPLVQLTVFSDEKTFGRGVPYQKDNKNLILNQPAELATIIPENKYDYVEWLENTQGKEDARLGYYPRPLFGKYLNERMNGWLKQSHAKVIMEKVEMVQILSNNKFQLAYPSGKDEFDVVHLCMGNFPYQDPYNLIDHENFIINPFPINEKLSKIPKNSTVGVFGTGLTSIDIFRYYYYDRPDLKLSFFSNSGRFKSVRGASDPIEYKYFTNKNIKTAKAKNNGFISLTTYIEWFKKEIDYQQISLNKDWLQYPFGSKETLTEKWVNSKDINVIQTLLLGMDPFITEIWMALTETDKQTFFDKYHGVWDKLRSSSPVESGEIMVSAWDEDKIKVFDNLVDIETEDKSFKFILKDKKPQYTDYIINAAGTKKNLSFEIKRIPLLKQLLNVRILQAETFGGVQISTPALSAVSQKYGVIDKFKVHGPLISGVQFGNNSIDIISETAKTAVLDIVEKTKQLDTGEDKL